jgi:hypothetical protein
MSLLREVLAELTGMFLADLRLALSLLAVIAAAALAASAGFSVLAGMLLILGTLGALFIAVLGHKP